MKLTYEQIIKVLEHCISASDVDIIDDCKECLLDEECGKDCDALLKTALDFIKYQHKVINSATQEIVDLKIKLKQQREEVERYKGVIRLLEKDVKDAKNEGIKEYSDFLIDKSVKGVIYAMDIPDYYQEMVGD